jgi:uncharacterized membrane protein
MSQQSTESHEPQSAAAKLFDLRILIGGLFTLYGVVLFVAGLFASPADILKASGVNINLWMGIAMFTLGVLFLLWWRLNPLEIPEPPEEPIPYEPTISQEDRTPFPE